MLLTRWYPCRLFWCCRSTTEIIPCVRLIVYAGELPGFIGGTNFMCDCRVYCSLPMAMYMQPWCDPPKSESILIALLIHSLWISVRDRKVELPWGRSPAYICDPPKSESILIALLIHSLWIPIRDRKVEFPWGRVSGLCVNNSQILSTAGVDTNTTVASFLL